MTDCRTHCPCCHAPRTATKRTFPLLDELAAIDRGADLELWHAEMRATRGARQAARARQTNAARKGHSTRLRAQAARDPLLTKYPAAFHRDDRAGDPNGRAAPGGGRSGCADHGVSLQAVKHGNSALIGGRG